jgi:hypothetical protein
LAADADHVPRREDAIEVELYPSGLSSPEAEGAAERQPPGAPLMRRDRVPLLLEADSPDGPDPDQSGRDPGNAQVAEAPPEGMGPGGAAREEEPGRSEGAGRDGHDRPLDPGEERVLPAPALQEV